MNKFLLTCAVLLTVFAQSASATTYYYDISSSPGLGGAVPIGTWASGVNAQWTTDPTGSVAPTTASWATGTNNDAVFDGTPSTAAFAITAGGVFAKSMSVNVNGYSFTSGSLTLQSASNIIVAPSVSTTFGSILAGTNGYKVSGGGTITLSNVSNSNTGAVSVTGGSTLVITTSGRIGGTTVGSGDITLDNGTLRNTDTGNGNSFLTANRSIAIGSGGGTVDVSSGIALIYGGSNATSLNAKITGTGNTLTKTGAGEFRYQSDGTALTTFSKLVVNQGLFRLGSSTISSVQQTSELGFGAAPSVFTPDAITLNGGSIGTSFGVVMNSNRGITLGLNGGTINASSGALTIPGAITGVGALTKSGSNSVTIGGANTFAGSFTITGGPINFDNDLAASSGNIIVTPSSATTLRNSVTLTTLANNITMNTGTSTIDVLATTGNTLVLNGTVSGSAGFTRGNGGGGGTVVLGGNNSGWAGGVTLKQGTLSLANKNALGSADLKVTPSSTGPTTVPLLSASVPLTGANAIANNIKIDNSGANGNTLHLTGSNDFELTGIIADGAGGAGAINKAGSSTVTLSGANTYTGGTTVTAGILRINNSTGSATGTAAVTVKTGGTLAGTGAITGAVTVEGGGAVSPGNSPGVLNVGSITFNAGSTFQYEVDSNAAPAASADLINALGDLTIAAGALLNVSFAGTNVLSKITLISYGGNWVNSGTFTLAANNSVLADDSVVTLGGNLYTIDYNDTMGGDNFGGGIYSHYVTLTAVPEPAAVLFGGLVCSVLGVTVIGRRAWARLHGKNPPAAAI